MLLKTSQVMTVPANPVYCAPRNASARKGASSSRSARNASSEAGSRVAIYWLVSTRSKRMGGRCTSSLLIKLGQPVEMQQWASIEKAPQKTLLRSSSSAHVRAGGKGGGIPRRSPSRRSSPIMWQRRTQFALLMADLLNSMTFAS